MVGLGPGPGPWGVYGAPPPEVVTVKYEVLEIGFQASPASISHTNKQTNRPIGIPNSGPFFCAPQGRF